MPSSWAPKGSSPYANHQEPSPSPASPFTAKISEVFAVSAQDERFPPPPRQLLSFKTASGGVSLCPDTPAGYLYVGTRNNKALQYALSTGGLQREYVDNFAPNETNVGSPVCRTGMFVNEPLHCPTSVPVAPLLLHLGEAGSLLETGENALFTASSHGFVRLWETDSADSIFSVPDVTGASALCVIKILGRTFAFVGSWDSTGILQIDIVKGTVTKRMSCEQPGTWVNTICMMDDKRTLLATCSIGPVHIFDAPSGRALATISHPDGVTISQVLTFGSFVFTSGSDGVIRKWKINVDSQEIELLLEIQGDDCHAPAIAIAKVARQKSEDPTKAGFKGKNPDNSKDDVLVPVSCIVVGCRDGKIKIIATADGVLLYHFQAHTSEIATVVVDARKRSAYVFDVDEEQLTLGDLAVSEEEPSLEGGVLYSSCVDGVVTAWDLASVGVKRQIAPPTETKNAVTDLAQQSNKNLPSAANLPAIVTPSRKKVSLSPEQRAERDLKLRAALADFDVKRGRGELDRTVVMD